VAFKDFAISPDFGERAQRWSDALLFGPRSQASEEPFGLRYGINGVALIYRDDHQYIAVLEAAKGEAESPLREAALLDPRLITHIFDGIKQALPEEPLSDVRILRIPNIALSAGAGTVINGSMPGTAGAAVTWGGGTAGFLTAGHVAHGTKHIKDASGSSVLGTTQAVLFPGAATTGSPPNVDVALISTTAAGTTFSPGSPISGSADIDLYLTGATKRDTVVGMISWYVFPGVGNYIDVYMTGSRCTKRGDSGAAVTMAASNDAIGTVVGGTIGTFTSFVQDINRQLNALKGLAGLSTLSL
jgi:hypothetical protein